MIVNMNMIKIHVISDLMLEFNEFSENEEILPDVDLVIINGNVGHVKRLMLYAETLCKKYPNIEFVVNLGESELYTWGFYKYYGEVQENITLRRRYNDSWPKNLHYNYNTNEIINLRNGQQVDVLCTYGFPKIVKVLGDWKDTTWYKNYVKETINSFDGSDYLEKPKETSPTNHGIVPVWATPDWVMQQHEMEYNIVKNWELNITAYKILVTHINPVNDPRLSDQKVSPYLIHLENGLWVTSNTVVNAKFLGAKLVSNPGRGVDARNNVFVVN